MDRQGSSRWARGAGAAGRGRGVRAAGPNERSARGIGGSSSVTGIPSGSLPASGAAATSSAAAGSSRGGSSSGYREDAVASSHGRRSPANAARTAPHARRLPRATRDDSPSRSPKRTAGRNAEWRRPPSPAVHAPMACGRASPAKSASSARLSAFASQAPRRVPAGRGTASLTRPPGPRSGCSSEVRLHPATPSGAVGRTTSSCPVSSLNEASQLSSARAAAARRSIAR